MGVIRRAPGGRDFVTVSNSLAQNSNLSFEARGVLVYLLSKPRDWEVQFADVEREGNIGRDKRQKIFGELETFGYFDRIEIREAGKFGYDYFVYDTPIRPVPEKPAPAEPVPANPVAVISISEQKKDLKKEREEETALAIFRRIYPEFVPSCFQQDLIETQVTDLIHWKSTVEYWASNGHQPRSIGKMIDKYLKDLETKKQPAPGRVVINDFDRCPICDNGFQDKPHSCPLGRGGSNG